ncbi:sulfate/molybdate ABC transporter ATP-binding protein [Microbacterium sp. A1-JK]|uniref:sulfate/molybdate ABC transporter ATP-binding protein n=1 Tax=Microbacterium sp. A1-JK TaxID=3177516 RepID=UPI0038887D80
MTFSFTATVADRGFDVTVDIAAGETVAVLGPNGAGKSTFLNVTAGLLRPTTGRARLDDRTLFDISPGRTGNRWLAPHERGVSMLAQDALLFPHLTARDNVAFGPRSKRIPREAANRTAMEWLERVDAAELHDRKPAQLSGGQAQRIAVARALASDPALLLLDEPMAALDVSVAPMLRRMLRDVLADRTAVIVTHDVLDAFTLADRVVVLEAGRIVDTGPTRDVLDRPATPFAAGLVALNLLVGTRTDDGIRTDDGHSLRARGIDAIPVGARVGVSIRPSSVTVTTGTRPARTSDAVTISGEITDLEPRGDLVRVRSTGIAADALPARVAELDLTPGATAWFTFEAGDALAYEL